MKKKSQKNSAQNFLKIPKKNWDKPATKGDIIMAIQPLAEHLDEKFDKLYEEFGNTKINIGLLIENKFQEMEERMTERLSHLIDVKISSREEKTMAMIGKHDDELVIAGHQIRRNSDNFEKNARKIKEQADRIRKLNKGKRF